MQKKGSLYLADWRDSAGVRRRKGFPSRREALTFQRTMRKAAHDSRNRSTPR